eukprot:TRINITY_DN14265_c0_g1_i1.p1 TRINITY_DN14265_c0_g1~~TRINITY_DN14265_c0_g1_i1.p1  ORF type:complete len:192 (-),score=52.90 TRINITY_DN14265_c0_g1_i1:112-633(-)
MDKFGYKYTISSPNIDEKAIRDENPSELVLKISRAKMEELTKTIKEGIIITSDQVIFSDNKIREKPISKEEAKENLTSYNNGSLIKSFVGISVKNAKTNKCVEKLFTSTITFKTMSELFIDKLIEKGTVMYCAGSFCIEEMEEYIDKIDGSRECIIGFLTKSDLDEMINQVDE